MGKNQVQTKKKEILTKHYDKDVFHNSIGDIFNSVNQTSKTSIGVSDLQNYQTTQRVIEEQKTTEPVKKEGTFFSKLFGTLESGLSVADHAAETINAYKNPIETDVSGVGYNTEIGTSEQPDSNMKIWYIVGGVLITAVVVGVIVTKKQ